MKKAIADKKSAHLQNAKIQEFRQERIKSFIDLSLYMVPSLNVREP